MKEYNAEANTDCFYRTKSLDKSLEDIKDTVLGRKESFLPFVTGDDDKLDKDKVEAFLDELIGAFTEYHEKTVSVKEFPGQETIDFYRDVLYCAIVAPYVMPGYAFDTEYSVKTTFKEIIEAVKDSGFKLKDRGTFIGYEESDRLSEYWDMEFIYSLNDAYYYLTDKMIRDSYNAEEKAIANEAYMDIVGQQFEEPDNVVDDEPIVLPPANNTQNGNNAQPENEEAGKEKTEESSEESNEELSEENTEGNTEEKVDTEEIKSSEVWETSEIMLGGEKVKINVKVVTPDDPEYEEYETDKDDPYNNDDDDDDQPPQLDYEEYLRQQEWEEQYLKIQIELCEETRKNWKEHIGSCDRLPETYMRLREKLFTVERANMEEDIIEMIDIFLYRHELSAMAFGKAYGLVEHRVDETAKLIDEEMKRVRLFV
ncbi:MAG: hypothetical protein IKO61_00920 [Lachnospiraceae bacterium]|nr:hypothetical protein [Lachnospiraceae bacterium]